MKKLSLLSLFAALLSVPCFAQESEEVIEGGAVQSRMIIASDDGSGVAPQVFMSSSNGGEVGQMFLSPDMASGWSVGSPDVFSLAQNSSVQKEIELVDEQLAQLKEINSEFSKRMQDSMAKLQDDQGNFDIQKAKDLGKMIREMNEEKNAKMQEVFLPHQFERLQQISLQTNMKRRGESNMLSDEKVIAELGLSEKQQKKIEKRSKEIKEELEKEIAELKAEAKEELLGELTSDQRKKLESMIGKDFEMKTPNFRQRVRSMRSGNKKKVVEDK